MLSQFHRAFFEILYWLFSMLEPLSYRRVESCELETAFVFTKWLAILKNSSLLSFLKSQLPI